MKSLARYALKRRRTSTIVVGLVLFVLFQVISNVSSSKDIPPSPQKNDVLSETVDPADAQDALTILNTLSIKGRASKSGYDRKKFSDGWARVGSCDVRNLILARDLEQIEVDADGCKVITGVLDDPYTDNQIIFIRGADTSDAVQIDHVVAVSDAWQKGAQQLSADERYQFYNDSLNLLAVDGDANQAKGGSDAASWLPSHKAFRCRLVARQIAVKHKYGLWVTQAERDAMASILSSCPGQLLPIQEIKTSHIQTSHNIYMNNVEIEMLHSESS